MLVPLQQLALLRSSSKLSSHNYAAGKIWKMIGQLCLFHLLGFHKERSLFSPHNPKNKR